MDYKTFTDVLLEIPNRTTGVDLNVTQVIVNIKCKCLKAALEGATSIYYSTLFNDDIDIELLVINLISEGFTITRVDRDGGVMDGLFISWSKSSPRSRHVNQLVENILKRIKRAKKEGVTSISYKLGWYSNNEVPNAVVNQLHDLGYSAESHEDLESTGYYGFITVKCE